MDSSKNENLESQIRATLSWKPNLGQIEVNEKGTIAYLYFEMGDAIIQSLIRSGFHLWIDFDRRLVQVWKA